MSNNASFAMPPASADLTTTWAFLEEGVDHIMTKLQTGVSYSKVFILYMLSLCFVSTMDRSICHYTQLRITIALPPRCMERLQNPSGWQDDVSALTCVVVWLLTMGHSWG